MTSVKPSFKGRQCKHKKALFAGCLVWYRFPEYEVASKCVLKKLGIPIYPLREASCCGSFVQGASSNWIYMAAYNLALAEQNNMDLITLCGGCTNAFRQLQYSCTRNTEYVEDINRVLKPLELEFHNTIQVHHILEVLDDYKEDIPKLLTTNVPLQTAVMNPCQVFRPEEIMQFDDADHPQVMAQLVRLTGAACVSYASENQCCGSTLTLADKSVAYCLGEMRLEELNKKGVETIITACGNCHLLLDRMQGQYYSGRRIPGIFLPQLIGIAMGFSPQQLMIKDPRLKRRLQNV